MITLQKLRYFLAAVDHGTLSAAAAELKVSQPTLSQQLGALESHLKSKLLLRSPFGVVVTPAGRRFYRHARSLSAQIESAEADAAPQSGGDEGQVSLGLATCGCPSALALPVLQRIQRDHPSIRLRLHDNFAGTLSDLVMTGRIDLAVVYTSLRLPGLKIRDLFMEELCLASSPSMSLHTRPKSALPISALRDLPAVLVSRVHFLRGVIDKTCLGAGFEPRVIAELDSLSTLLSAVRQGFGFTILPRTALEKDSEGLDVLPFDPPLLTKVSLCTAEHLPSTPPMEVVFDLIIDLVTQRLSTSQWPGVSACRNRP